jgi:hypothetical protein
MPGAEIFLDTLDRCWGSSLEERGSELDAVRSVVNPGPARLDELAGRDQRGMADQGDEIALASGLNAQDTKAVLGIVERDAVDKPRQDLGRAACSCCVRHDPIMAIIGRGFHSIP